MWRPPPPSVTWLSVHGDNLLESQRSHPGPCWPRPPSPGVLSSVRWRPVTRKCGTETLGGSRSAGTCPLCSRCRDCDPETSVRPSQPARPEPVGLEGTGGEGATAESYKPCFLTLRGRMDPSSSGQRKGSYWWAPWRGGASGPLSNAGVPGAVPGEGAWTMALRRPRSPE